MRPFRCSVCDQLLFFDNSTCLKCGSTLGFVPDECRLIALRVAPDALVPADGRPGHYRQCANLLVARCNWLIPTTEAASLCASCRLTTVRPNDDENDAILAFAEAEAAKRRLIHQLISIGLPIVGRADDEQRGVAFELLSSRGRKVTTGHEAGVITLDLSESDDAHREFVRQQLGEPYRTVLGHLRHEIGHYYWPLIVVDAGQVDEYRELFGDERVSYEDALEAHYAGGGAGADWQMTFVSQYATMHPWEDWAETFAHYLHIESGLETAARFGLSVGEPARSAGRIAWGGQSNVSVGSMVQEWLGLSLALNGMSRSIGQTDHYPFVLSRPVVEKLDFVHRVVRAAARPIAVDDD